MGKKRKKCLLLWAKLQSKWIVLEVHPWCHSGQGANLGVATEASLVPSCQSPSSRHTVVGNSKIKGLEPEHNCLKVESLVFTGDHLWKEHFQSRRRRKSHAVAVKLFCPLLKLWHLMPSAFPLHPGSVARSWPWVQQQAHECLQLHPMASETLSAPEKGYKAWEICS